MNKLQFDWTSRKPHGYWKQLVEKISEPTEFVFANLTKAMGIRTAAKVYRPALRIQQQQLPSGEIAVLVIP